MALHSTFNAATDVCIICSQKHSAGSQEKNILLQIKYIMDHCKLDSLVHSDHDCHRYDNAYNFHYHVHCRFGLECNRLYQIEHDVNQLGSEINSILGYFCLSAEITSVHEVMQLCRGYFPNAYRTMEKYLALRKKNTGTI